MRCRFHAGWVDWTRDVSHGSTEDSRDTLCDKLLPDMTVLDAVITYDRSIGTREAVVQEAACLYHFRTRRSDRRVRPARRRHDKGPPAGTCTCENGESAGQIIRGFDPRASQKQPAGHGGLTRE